MSTEITLVMPTRGRTELVKSYLEYLGRTEYRGSLIVADGSDESCEVLLQDFLRKENFRFHFDYIHVPRGGDSAWININECIMRASQRVKTRYAALCFDDDFVVSKFYVHACNFLDANTTVGFVVGSQIHLDIHKLHLARFRTRSIPQEEFHLRLLSYSSSGYQLCYAVVRSEIFSSYVSTKHREYCSAGLAADWSWYLAILSSGPGKSLSNTQVLRLRHDKNMQTYGQSLEGYTRALHKGAIANDQRLLSDRIDELDKRSTAPDSRRWLNGSIATSIVLRHVASTLFKDIQHSLKGQGALVDKSMAANWMSAFYRKLYSLIHRIKGLATFLLNANPILHVFRTIKDVDFL